MTKKDDINQPRDLTDYHFYGERIFLFQQNFAFFIFTSLVYSVNF